MGTIMILVDYLIWHYSKAIVSLFLIYRNFFWFFANFFSLPLLFRTWLAPWRRLNQGYPENITDIEAVLSTLVLNLLMRSVGFIMRTILILIGVAILFALTALLPIAVIVWLLLPLIIIFLFGLGVGLLFI